MEVQEYASLGDSQFIWFGFAARQVHTTRHTVRWMTQSLSLFLNAQGANMGMPNADTLAKTGAQAVRGLSLQLDFPKTEITC